MITIKYEYEVWEHYPDESPEPFGTVILDDHPKVDDIIMLKWSDGKDAYRVRIFQVNQNEYRLCVYSEKYDPKGPWNAKG